MHWHLDYLNASGGVFAVDAPGAKGVIGRKSKSCTDRN